MHNAGHIWNQLPSIFGLPGWDKHFEEPGAINYNNTLLQPRAIDTQVHLFAVLSPRLTLWF